MKQKHLLILNVVLIAAIMLASCTDTTRHGSDTCMKTYFKDLLKNVDKVQVQYFHAGDTLTRTLTQKDRIDIYKELINGKEDRDLKCDTTGRLLFFIKDTLRFDAYFSTPATGSKHNTGVVEYFFKPHVYKTLFTYRAGMSVDEYFYEFIKQKSDTSQNNR